MSGVAEESILTYREEEREGFVKQIKVLIRRASDQAFVMSYVVERGDISHLIFAQEQKSSADLAAIDGHGRSMVEEWLLWGVTRHVRAGSICDVLIACKGAEVR